MEASNSYHFSEQLPEEDSAYEINDQFTETTGEIPVDEDILAFEAIEKQSTEAVGSKPAQEEPFELIHGRKTEVQDEPTSSPVVAIGSIIADTFRRQPGLAVQKSAEKSQKPISKKALVEPKQNGSGANISQIISIYRQPILLGFTGALMIIIVFITANALN